MKIIYHSVVLMVACLAGCAEKTAGEDKARHATEAKDRADAAKKEMQVLPEAFKPRYNKRLGEAPLKTEAGKQTEQKNTP